MIRNIISDMGQVLICWNPKDMLQNYDLSEEETQLVLTELFQSVEWIQQDRGVLTAAQVAERVCARLPEKLHDPVKTLTYGWHQRHLVPMPGMEALIRELHDAGYHIYLLSNAAATLREYFVRVPGSDCFEGLMVSAEELLLKPSHEIYERLYERFCLNPAECWFIDDSPANIEGALHTGMGGTVFRGDVVRLRKELRAAGIACAE